MKMPSEILSRLLSGEHIDMEQRRALGLWPPESLRFSDVLEQLTRILQTQEWFPRPAIPSETIYIQRREGDEYVCIVWPGHAAKTTKKVFQSAREAAEFYLKWELHLPGSLDSWPVVDDQS